MGLTQWQMKRKKNDPEAIKNKNKTKHDWRYEVGANPHCNPALENPLLRGFHHGTPWRAAFESPNGTRALGRAPVSTSFDQHPTFAGGNTLISVNAKRRHSLFLLAMAKSLPGCFVAPRHRFTWAQAFKVR